MEASKGRWFGRGLCLLIAYLLGHAVVQAGLRTGTSFDGAEQLLYSQYFDWGYGRSQPPLYTWATIPFESAFGRSIWTHYLFRSLLLSIGFLGSYRMLREAHLARETAFITSLLLFLTPSVLMEGQAKHTHTAMVMAATPWFLWNYLALVNRRRNVDFVLLGVLIAALTLSKYNALVLICLLLAVDVWVQGRPSPFLDRRIAVSVAVALVLASPHVAWMIQNRDAVFALSFKFHAGGTGGWLTDRAWGLWQFAIAFGHVLGGALVATWLTARRRPLDLVGGRPDKVLLTVAILGIAMLIVAVLVAGVTHFPPRWLVPVLFLVLPALGWTLQAYATVERIRLLGFICAGVAIAGVALTSAISVAQDRRANYDYSTLALDLEAAFDFDTAMSNEYPVFGNFLFNAPGFYLVDPAMPPAGRRFGGRTIGLWTDRAEFREAVVDFASRNGFCWRTIDERTFTLPAFRGFVPLTIRAAPLTRADCPAA